MLGVFQIHKKGKGEFLFLCRGQRKKSKKYKLFGISVGLVRNKIVI